MHNKPAMFELRFKTISVAHDVNFTRGSDQLGYTLCQQQAQKWRMLTGCIWVTVLQNGEHEILTMHHFVVSIGLWYISPYTSITNTKIRV